jgi:hypothetical protein
VIADACLQLKKDPDAMNFQIARQQQEARLTVAVAARAKEVLIEYGPAAFDLPREAAVAHEAGHAVVAAALGLPVEFVKVTPVADYAGAWTGLCQVTTGAWLMTRDSPLPDILMHAKYLVAGLAGELVCKVALPGSSLDEVMQAQILAAMAADKLFPDASREQYAAAAEHIWNVGILGMAIIILRANRGPLDALMHKLDRRGEVRGHSLQTVLARVKSDQREANK